jgi:hypothetical protein
LERGRKVYFRESENIAIEMSLNQGRLVQSGKERYIYRTGSLQKLQPIKATNQYI